MNNTAEAPPLAAEQITLALDGVTVEGAPLEDIIRLDVGQGLLQAALKVFALLDPTSYYSAIVLSRTHQLELVKRWPKAIESWNWAALGADLSQSCLGDAPLSVLTKYFKSADFTEKYLLPELAFGRGDRDLPFKYTPPGVIGATPVAAPLSVLQRQGCIDIAVAGSFALHRFISKEKIDEEPQWPGEPKDVDVFAAIHGDSRVVAAEPLKVSPGGVAYDNRAVRLLMETFQNSIENKFFGGATLPGRLGVDINGNLTWCSEYYNNPPPYYWNQTQVLTLNPNYGQPRQGLESVAIYDVKLMFTCKDAGGRLCRLPTAGMSFIENHVDRLSTCSIETIINNFDINVCSVAMRPSGDGDHEYVVSPENAAAIRSKKMWLRSSYYRQPDQARVEKYRSRGFTLVAEPAQPAIP